MGAGSKASTAFQVAVSAAVILLVMTPSAMAVPRPGPHDAMLSSRFGCPVCHGVATGIFGESRGGDAGYKGVSDLPCLGCHTDNGAAPQVYGGDSGNYLRRPGVGHGVLAEVSCMDCHAVHGPWLADANGSPVRLLKRLRYQREAVKAWDPRKAPHDEAVSVWCTGCHASWPAIVEGKPRSRTVFRSSTGVSYDAHPMAAADGVRAFGDATSCRSCHAAGSPDGVGAGDYPHFTPGADAMLVGADAAESTWAPIADRSLDGVCLRCHRDIGVRGLVGVGITY